MLPFTDIDFFLFAGAYVLVFWMLALFQLKKHYATFTFILTLFYLIFYFKYTLVTLGFGILSYFYIRFLAQKINHRLVSAFIIAIPMLLVKLHLNPSFLYFAGLSFITFRSIQVCIDKKENEALSFISYFNFLFFIPSLYIGPLDRFKRFNDNSEIAFSKINGAFILKGFEELLKGVMYKFIIAEFIARYWLSKNAGDLTVMEITSDIYAYTFFLFFDFAGYSSMAVGMANLVGIDLPYNFKKPFSAVNPADFWQRWHASLTSWLTDYFFRPFYKWLSQLKKLKKLPATRQNIAIFFTFFMMGIWNGFEPNFVWSGIIYGFYSMIYNMYTIECRKKDKDVFFGTLNPTMVKLISQFMVFNLVCLALYVFSGR